MSLATPESIQELQRKLYLKAKQEPTYRFYALYDKVYRDDILVHAYHLAKANGGAAGVDDMRFADIEKYGVGRFLVELRQELQERRYRPEAVLRVMIPKPNGGERPLGIPTIKDRVVQTAVKLVLEPIFEADFTDDAYGYRPQRSAVQAVKAVHQALKAGFSQVVDADLSKYFDTIPHAELMRSVSRRVSDGTILHLVKMWLKAPVEETDERGNRQLSGGKKVTRGTPQDGAGLDHHDELHHKEERHVQPEERDAWRMATSGGLAATGQKRSHRSGSVHGACGRRWRHSRGPDR